MMKKITLLSLSCALAGAIPATSVAEEVLPALSQQVLTQFPQVDRNGDGKLSGREWAVVENFRGSQRARRKCQKMTLTLWAFMRMTFASFQRLPPTRNNATSLQLNHHHCDH